MNKAILGIVIVGAFLIGILSANPVVEAVGGWQLAFQGLDTRVTDLENLTPSVDNEFAVLLRDLAPANVGEFWGARDESGGPSSDLNQIFPKGEVPTGTINGFLVKVSAPDTLPVDVRLFLDGSPTTLSCTIPAGSLSCEAVGSVPVVGIGELVMKNEGPNGTPDATGVLREPTALLTMELD